MSEFIALIVFVVFLIILVRTAYRHGYHNGFVTGKRFIVAVMREVSPEATRQFREEMQREYQWDIYSMFSSKEEGS